MLSGLSFKFFFKQHLMALLIALALMGGSVAVLGQNVQVRRPTATTPPAKKAATVAPLPVPVKTEIKSVTPAVALTPVAQPVQVITIVHRLSGWKLRTWLTFTNAKVLDPALINQFVYTNIVAGYVLGDGRSVVARLPEADAEMFNLPAELDSGRAKTNEDSKALTLVRSDGARLTAKFIGLDGSTWLTLLEAEGLNLPPSREAVEESLSVGQRVRLFAPLRAQKTPATTSGGAAAVYMRVGEIKGTITNIARASTGRMTRLTVRAEGLSPQIVGGVVLNDAGETIGLVETSNAGEARVMPSQIVKRAVERIVKRRAIVPRPMLGVRGEAISALTLKQLETTGWKLEEASKLLQKQEGILLTRVTPDSPAALADLRAGDIILRVNNGEVKNTEDFSYLLNEAGGGASVQLTVLRADTAPREVTIKLSEALNLRRATEMSMAATPMYSGVFGANAATTASDAARREVLESLAQDAARERARAEMLPPTTRSAALVAGLDYIILPADKSGTGRNTATIMLVNLVRPGSRAEKLGLRAGDMVLSVNGQKLSKNEWAEKLLLRQNTDLTLQVMRGGERLTLKMQ